ncbi:MAG: hypothetical protein [Microviridae sp.]|nr:MAG: hypothetical protein [Microviridae sp.]
MWAELLGAGLSAISSLLGGDDEKQTTTTSVNTVNYKGMVKAAEAAGFNPLTAIRNGGTAGWTTTVGNVLSSGGGGGGSPVSKAFGALASGAQSFLNNYDPMRDQKRELEYKLLEGQLAQVSNAGVSPAQMRQFGNVPTRTASAREPVSPFSSIPHGAAPENLNTLAFPQNGPSQWGGPNAATGFTQPSSDNKNVVTNPWPRDYGVEIDTDVPDAQSFENRYGDSEIASMIGGGIVAYRDMNKWYNGTWVHKNIDKPISNFIGAANDKATNLLSGYLSSPPDFGAIPKYIQGLDPNHYTGPALMPTGGSNPRY